jgi:hypothetical protein
VRNEALEWDTRERMDEGVVKKVRVKWFGENVKLPDYKGRFRIQGAGGWLTVNRTRATDSVETAKASGLY